jgi:hypothetical protein
VGLRSMTMSLAQGQVTFMRGITTSLGEDKNNVVILLHRNESREGRTKRLCLRY